MADNLLTTRREGLLALAAGLSGVALVAPSAAAANPAPHRKIRVLAFGASNTWGFQPVDPSQRILRRLPFEKRWTGVAQRALGRRFAILEDALPGRSAAVDRPPGPGQSLPGSAYNGLSELPEALVRNLPLDIVVFQLGTNDLMSDPELPAATLCERLVRLCQVVSQFSFPIALEGQAKPMKAVIMAPTAIGPIPNNPNWAKAEATRLQALPLLQAEARRLGFIVFDGAEAVPKPGADGLHFGPEDHRRLGLLAAAAITSTLVTTRPRNNVF
jgi:lysophospholipase L1-like esterase